MDGARPEGQSGPPVWMASRVSDLIGEPAKRGAHSTEATMAALIVLLIITAITGILLGGFVAACRRIRRTDKRGTLRPNALKPSRRRMLAYASRWTTIPRPSSDTTPG